MRTPTLIFATFSTLCATACGGGAAYPGPRAAESGPSPAAEQTVSDGHGAPQGFSEESAPRTMAPPAPGEAAARASAPMDSERAEKKSAARDEGADFRPGLGTSWGETRVSRVSTAPFFRDDPDQPWQVASIHYNDEDGVRAMLRSNGFATSGGGSVSIGGAITVSLTDASGNPLRGASAGGHHYVVGSHGDRYMIQIKNHTSARFEAVATVDGLDVIDGHDGSFSKRGYIVSPWSTVEIDGFRQSEDTVAAFRFGSVSGSYAAQKGEDRNVGVIGIAVFPERGASWDQGEVDRRNDADPFPSRYASPPPGH